MFKYQKIQIPMKSQSCYGSFSYHQYTRTCTQIASSFRVNAYVDRTPFWHQGNKFQTQKLSVEHFPELKNEYSTESGNVVCNIRMKWTTPFILC